MSRLEEPLPLDAIVTGDRLRQLNRDTVDVLKQSIARIGLKVPISVRYVSDEHGFDLVAGLHRLEACRELGWTEIPVREETGTEDDARMWEIAENLHRAELTALERDEHIAEWVTLSQDKVSAQLAPKPQGGRPEGGINAAARELGIERTEAQRAVKVAEKLSPEAKDEARSLGLDDNQSALLKAAAEPTPEAQKQKLQEHAAKPRKARTPKAEPPAVPAPPAKTDNDRDLIAEAKADLDASERKIYPEEIEVWSSMYANFTKAQKELAKECYFSRFLRYENVDGGKRRAFDPPESEPPASEAPVDDGPVEKIAMPAEQAITDPLTELRKRYAKLSDQFGGYDFVMRRLAKDETPAPDDKSEVAEFVRRFIAAPKPIQNRFRADIGERPAKPEAADARS